MRFQVLTTPLSERDVRDLRIGDIIHLDGKIVVARDRAHSRLHELAIAGKPPPFELWGSAIYHCGLLVRRVGEQWEILAAGPTTSARMERFQPEIISRFGVRMVIGKGGMGALTSRAMGEFGAVYCAITGGAGALMAKAIKRVEGVKWIELGTPEAIWLLAIEKMGPMVVAIDSHGSSLYDEVHRRAKEFLESRQECSEV